MRAENFDRLPLPSTHCLALVHRIHLEIQTMLFLLERLDRILTRADQLYNKFPKKREHVGAPYSQDRLRGGGVSVGAGAAVGVVRLRGVHPPHPPHARRVHPGPGPERGGGSSGVLCRVHLVRGTSRRSAASKGGNGGKDKKWKAGFVGGMFLRRQPGGASDEGAPLDPARLGRSYE